jgi:hypothetical protein
MKSFWAFAIAVVVTWALLSTMVLRDESDAPLHSGQSQPPFDTFPPIYSASDAISRSLGLFPTAQAPISPTARLISHGTFEEVWFEWDPATLGDAGWDPTHPLWLVGVMAEGLTTGAIDRWMWMPGDGTAVAEGIFFAWDANSGLLRSRGALAQSQAPRTYGDLVALTDETITIQTATPEPTPEPSPTP